MFLWLAFFLIGLVSALAGVGGGVFFVPILLYLGYPPHEAVGTSAIAVAITTTSGALGYLREGLYDTRITLEAAAIAYPGVILGALLTVSVPGIVRPAIGAMLILTGIRAFKRFVLPRRLRVPGFFLAGLSVGLLGIGGGAIITPIIVSTSAYGLIFSIGISYTTMPLLTIAAAAIHMRLDSPDALLGIRIGILASFGAYIGSRIAGRYKHTRRLRYLVGSLMIIVGVAIVMRG